MLLILNQLCYNEIFRIEIFRIEIFRIEIFRIIFAKIFVKIVFYLIINKKSQNHTDYISSILSHNVRNPKISLLFRKIARGSTLI